MRFFCKENVLLDDLIPCLVWSVVLIVLILLCSFITKEFGTQYTEMDCNRSLAGVECSLTRYNTKLLIPSKIKIHNALAVDLSECDKTDIFGRDYYSARCYGFSAAEIRSQNVSYKIAIYSGYNRQAVRDIAKKINDFLISSNTSSFHLRF
jgi:hypothetical protein